MSTDHEARAAFLATTDAAQRSAGLIAARARGDLGDAEVLLTGVGQREQVAGSLFLAELAIALLARTEGRDVQDVAAELCLQLAAFADQTPT